MPNDQAPQTPQEPTTPPTNEPSPSLLNEGQKPADPPPVEETPEAKAAREAEEATKVANDTLKNPFKPEELKFSSEDIKVDPALAGQFSELVNKFGIPRDAVAGLVALQEQTMKAASEAGSAQWNELQETWRAEVSKDAEIGGEKLQPTLGSISKLLDRYGSPEVRAAFDLTGAGNNPQVIKFLAKVAKDLGEPGPISGQPGSPPRSAAEILFPNQGKQ